MYLFKCTVISGSTLFPIMTCAHCKLQWLQSKSMECHVLLRCRQSIPLLKSCDTIDYICCSPQYQVKKPWDNCYANLMRAGIIYGFVLIVPLASKAHDMHKFLRHGCKDVLCLVYFSAISWHSNPVYVHRIGACLMKPIMQAFSPLQPRLSSSSSHRQWRDHSRSWLWWCVSARLQVVMCSGVYVVVNCTHALIIFCTVLYIK